MRILGLIPARGGSNSILNKNLVDLGGRPLIEWTINSAKKSKLVDIIVSTDSPEIAEVAQDLGVRVPFLRPEALSGDQVLSIDVVLHALENLKEKYQAVLLLQPTSPFRSSSDIDDAIEKFDSTTNVISVVDVGGNHPARMKFIEDGLLVDPPFVEEVENMPRQNLQSMYIRNGAIYLTNLNDLKDRTFKGSRCRALIMPQVRSLNIDSEFDLEIARALLIGGLV